MKVMKRKILGLLLAMLMFAAVLPLAASATQVKPTASFGSKKTFVSGFIAFPPRTAIGGMYMYFFAISMRAGEIGGTYHVYRFQPIFVKTSNSFHGIAMPGYIMGWFDGSIGLIG